MGCKSHVTDALVDPASSRPAAPRFSSLCLASLLLRLATLLSGRLASSRPPRACSVLRSHSFSFVFMLLKVCLIVGLLDTSFSLFRVFCQIISFASLGCIRCLKAIHQHAKNDHTNSNNCSTIYNDKVSRSDNILTLWQAYPNTAVQFLKINKYCSVLGWFNRQVYGLAPRDGLHELLEVRAGSRSFMRGAP